MNILLVGEYNRSHRNLKEGLSKLGHQVLVVGMRDGFKKVDVDIEIKAPYRNGILRKVRALGIRLFNKDLHFISVKNQLIKNKERLKNYAIVQFINEASFLCRPKDEIALFDLLNSWNSKTFLLSCGTDYPSVKFAIDKKFRYSILTPFFEGRVKEQDFALGLHYLNPEYKKLHHHLYNHISGVISCDLDYLLPLKENEKHLGMVPHPVNTDLITYQDPNIDNEIIIFHGINRTNYYKKGNDIFEAALDSIKKKYPKKIRVLQVEDLPYKAYINAFDTAHILLDQVYAYDQGYNALEAMAKGKVVFTGAEQEWLDYYNLKKDTVAINALPDTKQITEKLEWLINNPEEIKNISEAARSFVEREHHYIKCSERFIKLWTETT